MPEEPEFPEFPGETLPCEELLLGAGAEGAGWDSARLPRPLEPELPRLADGAGEGAGCGGVRTWGARLPALLVGALVRLAPEEEEVDAGDDPVAAGAVGSARRPEFPEDAGLRLLFPWPLPRVTGVLAGWVIVGVGVRSARRASVFPEFPGLGDGFGVAVIEGLASARRAGAGLDSRLLFPRPFPEL